MVCQAEGVSWEADLKLGSCWGAEAKAAATAWFSMGSWKVELVFNCMSVARNLG